MPKAPTPTDCSTPGYLASAMACHVMLEVRGVCSPTGTEKFATTRARKRRANKFTCHLTHANSDAFGCMQEVNCDLPTRSFRFVFTASDLTRSLLFLSVP